MKKYIKLDKNSKSVKETLYLLKNSKNAQRLKQAISDFKAEKNFKTVSIQK